MTRQSVFITNISSFLPNDPVSNDEIEQVLGVVGGKPSRARKIVLGSNGIKTRYYVIDKHTGKITHSNAQLTAEAIRGLVSDNFSLEQIDCLVTGTTIPDQLMPNHGLMVHGELGNPSCEVVSTSGICASGMTAMKYAYMSILTGEHENAVATGSEVSSLMMHARRLQPEAEHLVNKLQEQPIIAFEKDFLRWMLSDGAGATLLQRQPNANGISLRIDWLKIFSYANEEQTCMYAGAEKQDDGSLRGWLTYDPEELLQTSVMSVKQDVRLLNDKVVYYTVEKPVKQLIEQLGIRAEDYDYFLPHISSMYFSQPVQDGLKRAGLPIPEEKWFTNLSTTGNIGSASIYVMLGELFRSGDLQPGQKILCYVPESGRFSTSFMQLTVV